MPHMVIQRQRCDAAGYALGDPVIMPGVLVSDRAVELRMSTLYRKHKREGWDCTRTDEGLTCKRNGVTLRFDWVRVNAPSNV